MKRTWRHGTIPAAALATGVALSGCGGEAEAAPDGVVTVDSAGVTVVENRRPAWSEGDAWRVGEEPEISIGGLDAPLEYTLYQVAGALRLDDGRIVVADRGSSELRYYDGEGVHLRSVGRPGEGPGEFGVLWSIERYRADSLLIWDSGNTRVSVHDLDGAFQRSFKLEGGDDGTPYFPGPRLLPLRDGSLLGFHWLNPMGQPEGLFRPIVEYLRFSPTGERSELVVRAPYREWMLARFDPGYAVREGTTPTAMTPLFFGRDSHLSVHDGTIWIGRAAGDGYTLHAHAEDGTLVRRVENRVWSPVPVEERHVQAEIDARLEAMEAQVERMPRMQAYARKQEETMEKLETPEFFPPYRDLRTSADGHVWVQAYVPPGVAPTRWTVFDPEGRLLGDVALPEDLRVMDIGADYVLGSYRDDFDVEHVRLHRIVKPAS